MKGLNFFVACIASLIWTSCFCQSPTLDPTFGTGGVVTDQFSGDFEVGDVAIQNDLKTVLVGTVVSGQEKRICVARYLIDGIPDPTFGVDGKIFLTEFNAVAGGLVVLPDQRLLVSGYSIVSTPGNTTNGILFRLNIDGSLDSEFGDNGIAITDYFSFSGDLINDHAICLDGSIISSGSVFNPDPVGVDFVLSRHTSSGVIDSIFGFNGIERINLPLPEYEDISESCVVQPDGKIVQVGGRSLGANQSSRIVITRAQEDGSLDNSFGNNGYVLVPINGSAYGLDCALQEDGKILVCGAKYETPLNPFIHSRDMIVLRLSEDGSIDSTFNGVGMNIIDIDFGEDISNSIHVDYDGSILISGLATVNSANHFSLVKLLQNGTLDQSFGSQGVMTLDRQGTHDNSKVMSVYEDSIIVLAGETVDFSGGTQKLMIARLVYEGLNGANLINAQGAWVYPNPIVDNSIIRYNLGQDDVVSIQVYDSKGKVVQAILKDEVQPKGKYAIQLKMKSNLSSGLYTVRISSSLLNESIKIIK